MGLGDIITSALSTFTSPVRTGKAIVFYQPPGGAPTDITAFISGNQIEFNYKDHLAFHTDPIEFSLADPDNRFVKEYSFQIGGYLNVALEQDNWHNTGEHFNVPIGKFCIDEIESTGPPNVVHLRATEYDISTSLKWERKSGGWEDSNLSDIANDISQRNGMGDAIYQAKTDPTIARVDQNEEPDLVFLERQCREYCLMCRIHNGKIIIFDVIDAEAQAPKYTVVKPTDSFVGGIDGGGLTSWTLVSSAQDTYQAAAGSNLDTNTGENIQDPNSYYAPDASSPSTPKVKYINHHRTPIPARSEGDPQHPINPSDVTGGSSIPGAH